MNYGLPYQQQGYQPITATFPNASADPHYKGYEQAVIEHAKLMQIQQAKEQIFGVPAKRKPFVGQWQKKKGPPKEPVDPRKYFCETCNITCAGPESFQAHMVGKSHKHKEALKSGKIRLDLSRPGFHCEVCNATCSSKEAFTAHVNGTKHNRAIKTLQMLGKPIPEHLLEAQPKGDPMQNLPVKKKVVGVSATKFVGGVKLSTMTGEEDEVVNSNESEGQKIDASLKVEEKVLSRGPGFMKSVSQQKPVQLNRSIASKINQTARFPHCPSVLPDTTNHDAFDEQFVHARLEQLHPGAEFMEKVEELVESIERGLKKISDLFVETANQDNETRLLRGVVRVGPLGENLMLNFDKQVNVVLLCKDIPSLSLLNRIVTELPNHIEGKRVNECLTIDSMPDDSAFTVRFKDLDVTCTVTLTSVVLRSINNESEEKNNETGAISAQTDSQKPRAIAKPADALPEEPCLQALASLRHTKFFQAQCAAIPNLAEVVRLLRDVVKRIDTWSVLSLYILELLAYKALSSHPTPLRVSDGLRRFFEMIASGAFMSAYSKLLDPCEKEEVNALQGMTAQQRENLVCSAQHGLRLVAYDQIFTILGMSRDVLTRKRPAETDSAEASWDSKKPKTDLF